MKDKILNYLKNAWAEVKAFFGGDLAVPIWFLVVLVFAGLAIGALAL